MARRMCRCRMSGSIPKIHTVKVGLNYRMWDRPPSAASARLRHQAAHTSGIDGLERPRPDHSHSRRAIRASARRIKAPTACPAADSVSETWTVGAFLGWRLWEGGEFYFNPELAQGFGIGGTLGLAGFSNGEAQKGGASIRNFARNAIPSARHSVWAANRKTSPTRPINLPGKRDIDRITVTVGRFAVGDFFDGNSYAKDPRARFHELGDVGFRAPTIFPPICRASPAAPSSNSIARTGRFAPAFSRCPARRTATS